MYKDYVAKGKETVIESFPLTDKSEIRVKRIEDEEGNVTGVDIRQWYYTQKDPMFKAGKGIRIKAELAESIARAIQQAVQQ